MIIRNLKRTLMVVLSVLFLVTQYGCSGGGSSSGSATSNAGCVIGTSTTGNCTLG